jgi:hypothetical protein
MGKDVERNSRDPVYLEALRRMAGERREERAQSTDGLWDLPHSEHVF